MDELKEQKEQQRDSKEIAEDRTVPNVLQARVRIN